MATKLFRRGAVERKRALFALLLLESLLEDAIAPPLLVELVVKLVVVIVLPKTTFISYVGVFLTKKKTIFSRVCLV